MNIFQETFINCTDELQPYSIISEAIHKYTEPDGEVRNGTFYLKRSHTRQLLQMPDTNEFNISFKISHTYPTQLAQYKTVSWGMFFGYDKLKRSGYEIIIEYFDDENKARLFLYKVSGVNKTEINRKDIDKVKMYPDIKYDILMEYNKKLKISFFDQIIYFDVNASSGIIAIAKESGVSEVGFSELIIEGGECEKKSLFSQKFIIPKTDGGVLDYCLEISVASYIQENPLYEISYELSGGAYSNPSEFHAVNCWVAEYDVFNGLYFSFGNKKYYISKNKIIFVDNYYKNLKDLLCGSDIPFKGYIRESEFGDFQDIFIGYDKRFSLCAGNLVSDRMFMYNKNGKLIYIGKELDKECFFVVQSDYNKKMAQIIPKNCVDYEDALFHAQSNHYFFAEETPEFYIDVYYKADRDFLTFESEFENTWFEKIYDAQFTEIDSEKNIFENYGYKKTRFYVKGNSFEQGVYHLKFICNYGTYKVFEHTSAFEVIDDAYDESPQETAGIPTIYCGDAFPTKYSTYDLAVVRPDFNITHYINSSLHIPEFTEKRRTWELLHLYHRNLFVWMTQRTFGKKDETGADYPETIKHADYINYLYPGIEDSEEYYRYDLWKTANFDGKLVKEFYQLFLEENENLQTVFPPLTENGIDIDKWSSVPSVDFDKWINYINDKTKSLFLEQWNAIKKINPNAKRFSYGPFPVYGNNHSGAYNTKWYGFSQSGISDIFDGFLKLEDYPFICGYQTHNCAWNMSLIKLEWKDTKIAPDLYDSFGADCPDGFVAYAKPPMGESYAPPYQTVTQLYEYLYNTAIFENEKFRFWDDNFIGMYDHISHEPEDRYKTFLRAWKIFLDNKPNKPLKTTAFITEFDCDDDRRSLEVCKNSIYNMCQTAMAVINEVNTELGLSQSCVMKTKSMTDFDMSDTDVLVLPSLRNFDKNIKEKIRQLYNNGTAIIATGDVSGLEDIFGVTPKNKKTDVFKISYNDEYENVYPYKCEIFYDCVDAEHLVTAGEEGIILKKGKTLLINSSLGEIGVDSLSQLTHAGRANISKLIRKAIGDFLLSVSYPVISAKDNCGIRIIKTVHDEILIVLTDYSPYSQTEEREVYVDINNLEIKNIEYLPYDEHDISFNAFKKNDLIKRFSVKIRPHEALIFKAFY